MFKNIFVYFLTLLFLGSGIYFILHQGKRLETQPHLSSSLISENFSLPPPDQKAGWEKIFFENLKHPLSLSLLQIIVILFFSWILRKIFLFLAQPPVLGEILGGVLLGPSLFGWVWPSGFQFLFSPSSLGGLKLLSEIGIILFMFVVGLNTNKEHFQKKANSVVIISHISIIFPYFLGVGLAFFLYQSLAPDGVGFLPFALFMGIALSITAFPVLARILEERKMAQTEIGVVALSCAAIDDVTAWGLLALVVSLIRFQGPSEGFFTLVMSLIFIGGMFWVVKPVVVRIFKSLESPSHGAMVGIFIFILSSALVTELIGVHIFLGAFLAGVCLSSINSLKVYLKEHFDRFSSSFFLPLFFALTGLRTQVGLLNDFSSWVICVFIITVAVLGKFGGGSFAARFTGMSWADSLALGALMNTRGLMELISLNIGYDLGILTPEIFTMMVIMALVTTFMTGPLLSFSEKLRQK